jgi:hypothetical protein
MWVLVAAAATVPAVPALLGSDAVTNEALASKALARAPAADLPVHSVVEEDGLVYAYDALLDRETLVAASDRETDVAAARPEELRRMRAALLLRLRVDSLATIRDAHAEVAASLRRLGYL